MTPTERRVLELTAKLALAGDGYTTLGEMQRLRADLRSALATLTEPNPEPEPDHV